jgi:NAD(P)H-hydrate repair Nnr-like enzyme with NAD(P)H-hydrate dehydratase domain
VLLKGAETWIACPGEGLLRYPGGGPGLATGGSGDVLAGIIGGLLARGAAPRVAAAWGVWLHGEAGRRLAERICPLGFLGRELLGEIPRLLAAPG